MRLIDADELIQEIVNNKTAFIGTKDDVALHDSECDYAIDYIESATAIDAIPIKVIESWLYSIAINNVGHRFGGGTFEECCVEIIKRLDGLVLYNKERKDCECNV